MNNNISDFLKDYREKNNITLKEMADLIGISFVELNNIELRKNKPSAKTIQKISKTLNLDFDYLFNLEM